MPTHSASPVSAAGDRSGRARPISRRMSHTSAVLHAGRHQRRRVRKRHAQAQHQRHQHVPHRVRAVVQKARQIGKIALGGPGRVNADIAGRAQRQPVKEREGQKKHRRQRQRLQRGPAAGTGGGSCDASLEGGEGAECGVIRAAAEGARCARRRSRKARGRAAAEGARCAGRGGEAGRPVAAPPQRARVARGAGRGGEAGRPVVTPPQSGRALRGAERPAGPWPRRHRGRALRGAEKPEGP